MEPARKGWYNVFIVLFYVHQYLLAETPSACPEDVCWICIGSSNTTGVLWPGEAESCVVTSKYLISGLVGLDTIIEVMLTIQVYLRKNRLPVDFPLNPRKALEKTVAKVV